MLSDCGLSREDALTALLPLIRGAVNALECKGLPDALTGPVVRGDSDTVSLHLQHLMSDPQLLLLYRTLSLNLLAQLPPDEIHGKTAELLSSHTVKRVLL
jgi:predicted short-subunit dehydrogenase-like oxidoreductase (DUF2520 family)